MRKYKYGLFDAVGLEFEYMIVDRDNLNIKPIADKILIDCFGKPVNEINFKRKYGLFSWSNELVNHVIEIKVSEPVNSLKGIDSLFYSEIKLINHELEKHNAVLMPTGMHPWMKPEAETILWTHEANEIYSCFDRIFTCKGHGWSNLQSVHINLPFLNDLEFFKLHTAIRTILPIIPAISAGTPIVGNSENGVSDNRLKFYEANCRLIPSVTGKVIPEMIFSVDEYRNKILERIFSDLKPYDPKGIICHDWVNARGALPNFERGSIEIRIIDIQECPKMDMAIVETVIAAVKFLLMNGDMIFQKMCELSTGQLYEIFSDTVNCGSKAVIRPFLERVVYIISFPNLYYRLC